MHLVLERHAYLTTCTLGSWRVGPLAIQTIERPWLPDPRGPGGQRRLSCIPDGVYELFPHTSDKFPNVYALRNPHLGVWYQPGDMPAGQLWGRSAILAHGANKVADVIGCIGCGIRATIYGNEHIIAEAAIALDELRRQLGRAATHTLEIRATWGTATRPAALPT